MKAGCAGLLCLLLSAVLCSLLVPAVVLAHGDQVQQEQLPADFHRLRLGDYIHLVSQRNERILSEGAQWAITKEDVRKAESIFEPDLLNSYQHQGSGRRNTIEERANLNNLPFFKEQRDSFQAAVEGLEPFGGRLRLGYSMDSFHNTLDEYYGYGINREYQTFLGLSLTQPLLKGAGMKATTAGIRAAREDAEIGLQSYRMQIFRTVSEAVASYWNLYLAQEIYRIRKESTRIAQDILRDNLELFRGGKTPETEVSEARAGLAVRKSLLQEASQAIVFAKNHMLSLLSSAGVRQDAEPWSLDQIKVNHVELNFSKSVREALKLKPEYLSSLRKVKKEEIKLEFAKNQRWPQLDLKGSYGLNGLADSFGNSWDDATDHNYTSWTVGMELRIPLGGGRKSKSELAAAKQRKRQAILEVKAAEVSIANNLDTAVGNVKSALNQVAYYTNAVDIYRKLMKIELARLAAGKSNSRITLDREQDLVKARESEVQSLVNYKKAMLQFEVAEGSLLLRYGVEPKRKAS